LTCYIKGPISAFLQQDAYGYREYKLKWLIESNDTNDSVFTAIHTPGLPIVGTAWLFGNDSDVWVWCRRDGQVTQIVEAEPNRHFFVEQMFSNKPPEFRNQICQDTVVENPILEPQKIRGGFVRHTQEAAFDRFGNQLLTSSHEQIRGAQVEFDLSRDQVHIEQNVATLDLALCESMKDTVNTAPLWGLPERTIKLSNFNWERKFYKSCLLYYTRMFDFEVLYHVNQFTGITENWDRDVADEGTKVLNGKFGTDGHWHIQPINTMGTLPDANNPLHFIRFQDKTGNQARVLLNGHGLPYEPPSGTGTGSNLFRPDQVQSLVLAFGGQGYTSTPAISFSGGGGSGAAATANLDIAAGTVKSVTLTNPGAGYTSPPTVTFAGGLPPPSVDPFAKPAVAFAYLGTSAPGRIHIERYDESDFTLLGIPLTF
jgi:hypothetical protein